MKQPTIWFNKGLSSTGHVISSIRQAEQANDNFRFVASHTHKVSAADVSDVFEFEPSLPDGGEYVEWCLDFVQRHQVDVFIPRKHAVSLSGGQQRFVQAGVKLLAVGTPDILTVIGNKAALYQAIGADLVPVPDFLVANNSAEFVAAISALQSKHEKVCFKPTQSIGGKGFLIISNEVIISPWDGKVISTTADEACLRLASQENHSQRMIMQFLNGQERSVDCLADQGQLLCGIVRLKSLDGDEELLEENPLILEYCRRLTEKLRLNGLFNVQFMEHDGQQFLLEINARLSGGVSFGAFSGVCLPYWAIRLALGTAVPADIPKPRTGIRIKRATGTVLL